MMTKFNPENKETLTFGECLGPAMEITDPQDAQQYLAEYVNHIQKYLDKEPREDNMTAEDVAKVNLGYYAGYYDNETRGRVESLFTCVHPIFGTVKDNGIPTAEEALELGRLTAKNRNDG